MELLGVLKAPVTVKHEHEPGTWERSLDVTDEAETLTRVLQTPHFPHGHT